MWQLRTKELVLLYCAAVLFGVHIMLPFAETLRAPLAWLVSALVTLVLSFGILRTASRRTGEAHGGPGRTR